jgi:hypothetical protein
MKTEMQEKGEKCRVGEPTNTKRRQEKRRGQIKRIKRRQKGYEIGMKNWD